MTKKRKTTFDRWMQDRQIKMAFDEGYNDFLLSELVRALMAEDKVSVRTLAEKVGLSPTVIQNIRSGKQKDMKFLNVAKIASVCGYRLVFDNGKDKIQVS